MAARPGSVGLSRARLNPAHRHPRRRVDRLLRRRMLAGCRIDGHLYRSARLCKDRRAWPDLERLWRMDGGNRAAEVDYRASLTLAGRKSSPCAEERRNHRTARQIALGARAPPSSACRTASAMSTCWARAGRPLSGPARLVSYNVAYLGRQAIPQGRRKRLWAEDRPTQTCQGPLARRRILETVVRHAGCGLGAKLLSLNNAVNALSGPDIDRAVERARLPPRRCRFVREGLGCSTGRHQARQGRPNPCLL